MYAFSAISGAMVALAIHAALVACVYLTRPSPTAKPQEAPPA